MPRAIAGTTTQQGSLLDAGTSASPAMAPVPATEESRRLVRLAELEQQAEEVEAWEQVKQARVKRDAILDELQRSLDSYFGSKVACPLCDPLWLELLPLTSPRLRNCTRHSLPLFLMQGRRGTSEPVSIASSPSSSNTPKSQTIPIPGGKPASSSTTLLPEWAAVPMPTPSESPIRSLPGMTSEEHGQP